MNSTGRHGLRGAAVWLAMVVGAAGVLAPGLRADEPADQQGAPARAVRLSNVEGQVQLAQGSKVLADQALANTPLFEGSVLTTGNDGRAEVQFEDGSVARISPDSSLTLQVLKPGGDTEVVLNSGLGYFELQGGGQGGAIRVRFGSAVATGSGFTVLRVKLDQAPGELAVFSGNAHLEGGETLQVDLHGGESVALSGGDSGQYNVAESIEPDSWDAWNTDRDQALTASEAGTSPAQQGAANGSNPAWGDLNQNGSWYNTPDGYVWSPYEASSPAWDPYGTGYWMDQPGYGYTWVSGEPWGYMPYQCGAWNYYNAFGWGWAPGMCQTWWGGGGGWGFNVGIYPPWYHVPLRPVRPRGPRPGNGLRAVGLAPVVAVNRRLPSSSSAMLPPRNGTTSVNLGGHLLMPVQIERSQPVYTYYGAKRASNGESAAARPAYSRQGATGPSGTYPAPHAPGGSRPASSAPRPASAPHPSSSGGGHPASGGGGGGGGHPASSPKK